uniref:CCN family member 1 n=1 Tax=Sander lucioperca TaxID=283035 RepID=A0A8C9XEY5_SANLU
ASAKIEIQLVIEICKMSILSQVSASCPKDCQCPPDNPRCAAGVSLMLDGCGCCKVCARQLFEDCSNTQPCDHTKGLECNFGGGYGSSKGICRAKSDGRTCEYNNKIYQNGEIFRPNCKHQCTCMDGAVGCVSLCPYQLTLPKLGCTKPKRVKVQGRCCEQLICPEEAKTESSVVKKHRKKQEKNRPGVECVSQTTTWSPCSKSCGTGVSTRVTNSNTQCKLVKETRICKVRPCNQNTFTRLKKGQKCNHIDKARRPVKLYCGSCSDGQCCRPHRTQTLPVHFRCKHGEIISRMVMMIESCKCNLNCNGSNEKTPFYEKVIG